MKQLTFRLTTLALALLTARVAVPAEAFYYPPAGRTKAQQQQDQFECHQWAVEQSKFDPVAYAAGNSSAAAAQSPSSAQAAQPPAGTDSRSNTGRALIGGAAAGAAIGEVANNDAAEGAAAGAGLGLLRGRMAEKKAAAERAAAQAKAQQQSGQQQAAQAEELRVKQDAYQRARSTCFKARGYTVSDS